MFCKITKTPNNVKIEIFQTIYGNNLKIISKNNESNQHYVE